MGDQGDGVQMVLNGVLLLLVSELMFVMSFWAVTPNGITLGEWLCTTECTSARSSKMPPWMKRSR